MGVKILDLEKSYASPDGSTLNVINIPELAVVTGEELCVVGPSGSGKTTLLNLVAGIVSPDEGSIFIRGEDLTIMAEAERDLFRAWHIGYIFQTHQLLAGLSARENIMLPMLFTGRRSRMKARATTLLDKVGLIDRQHHKPPQLSLGEQQRVAVARALANAPSVILADEPTGSLDVENAQKVIDLIRELCREEKVTLIWVTHEAHIMNQFNNHYQLQPLPSSRPVAPVEA